jgi:quinol monooxygenase YgiN
MSHVGLLVRLEAKPDKAEELADFLKGALPAAKNEPGTASWFALRIGPTTFGIYDSFPDDGARQKHLSGPIAAALTAKAPRSWPNRPRSSRSTSWRVNSCPTARLTSHGTHLGYADGQISGAAGQAAERRTGRPARGQVPQVGLPTRRGRRQTSRRRPARARRPDAAAVAVADDSTNDR